MKQVLTACVIFLLPAVKAPAFRRYDDSIMTGYTKVREQAAKGEKQPAAENRKEQELLIKAAALVKRKDFAGAEETLRLVHGNGRNDAWINKALGFVAFNRMKPVEAIAWFENAAVLEKPDSWLYAQLGSAWELRADLRLRDKFSAPRDAEALRLETEGIKKDFETALDYTKKALIGDVSNAWLLSQAGKILGNLDRHWEALGYLTRAESAGRDDPWLYSEIGWDYGIVGDYRQALDYFRLAAEKGRDDAWIYSKIAWSYDKLGEYENAIDNYLKASALSPDDAWAVYNLGVAYRNNKDYDKALDCYEKIRKTGAYSGWTQLQTARIYAEQGRKAEAQPWLEEGKSLLDTKAEDVRNEIEQIESIMNKL
ncbi:MAG: tetratricopeptide repeat protein [Fusobacteriaceae bacterium]|jgi:tetratricopeptide (TPR) repeat protein|nr:tetratricopeptide repeat protein [Fusobacteriaceae bacterium]